MVGLGHRIYFGKDELQFVLLLLGGDNSTQVADPARAQGSQVLPSSPHTGRPATRL